MVFTPSFGQTCFTEHQNMSTVHKTAVTDLASRVNGFNKIQRQFHLGKVGKNKGFSEIKVFHLLVTSRTETNGLEINLPLFLGSFYKGDREEVKGQRETKKAQSRTVK